uniref:Alternative protein USP9Y n=1 Tax=Homo sapiens TaxID=9606 RepID=L8E838_HUMAN|nr:alternative protein USP9Y [Homo sapiens]
MTRMPQMSMSPLHQKMPHYILIHLPLSINRIIMYMDSHIQDQQHIT